NKRGALRGLATGVDEIGIGYTARVTFGMRNQGLDSEGSLAMAEDVLPLCEEQGRPAQATIAVAFGSRLAGSVATDQGIATARRIAAAGAIEVALADTIGIARPGAVERLVAEVKAAIAPVPVRVHFHDTRGMGVANVMAAVRSGAAIVDAAIGGTGGCPFAPG